MKLKEYMRNTLAFHILRLIMIVLCFYTELGNIALVCPTLLEISIFHFLATLKHTSRKNALMILVF